jgi:hypothetical protein
MNSFRVKQAAVQTHMCLYCRPQLVSFQLFLITQVCSP